MSVATEETTSLMQELQSNELAEELKEEIEFYEGKYDYKVFVEIFVTNKYGVNIAQSQRTSDYYQADEEWWQEAKKNGLFVDDVGYDESAIPAADLTATPSIGFAPLQVQIQYWG